MKSAGNSGLGHPAIRAGTGSWRTAPPDGVNVRSDLSVSGRTLLDVSIEIGVRPAGSARRRIVVPHPVDRWAGRRAAKHR
ncbi:hypothetical protein AB0B25_25580 [Nocardia sp. NPDC049190]|uniref:hypothetical protein n=1 Tax=Nocardia sp. NPDC049190 TaxID=3155650 RepID=UPI0033C20382